MCRLRNGYIISELDENYSFTYNGELLQYLVKGSQLVLPL